jgi:hypothetical protein
LQHILREHDSAQKNYEYHRIAIEELLASNSEFALPKWLIEPLVGDFADLLIRAYLSHSRLHDALNLAIKLLERARTSTAHRHDTRWTPTNTLDRLLEALKLNNFEKEHERLIQSIADYQAELAMVSK